MNVNMRSTLPAAALILALLLVFTACDSGDDTAQQPAAKPDSVALAPGAAPSTPSSDTTPAAADTALPVATQRAVIATDVGDITIDLYGMDSPKTVRNFVGLAKKHFYDSIGFHRIVPDYVIQAGDPFTKDTLLYDRWGTGGESIFGGTFDDELDPNTAVAHMGYIRGAVAMANRGPNTNLSQFFIVLDDNVKNGLPYNYTIFGKVVDGWKAVDAIAGSSPGVEIPRHPVRIHSITITPLSPAS